MEDEMSPSTRVLLPLGAILALLPLVAQERSPQRQATSPEQHQAATKQQQSRGERVFNQNCARCHDAPQNFPPQISGTIVRHMRVRASLSSQDEKALIQFMNP
jgi:mono/diheme cytochrome c family protein